MGFEAVDVDRDRPGWTHLGSHLFVARGGQEQPVPSSAAGLASELEVCVDLVKLV